MHIYVYLYAFIYTKYIYLFIYECVHLYICIFIYIYMCIYIYIYIYVCIYIYIGGGSNHISLWMRGWVCETVNMGGCLIISTIYTVSAPLTRFKVNPGLVWLPKKPTRVAAPSPRASLGRRTVCGRTEQRRLPGLKRYETKVRLVWVSFIIAAAALNTPTRNGYNTQGVNLTCNRNFFQSFLYVEIGGARVNTNRVNRVHPRMEWRLLRSRSSG